MTTTLVGQIICPHDRQHNALFPIRLDVPLSHAHAMPLLPEIRASHTPLGPGSSADNMSSPAPVEGPDPQAKRTNRKSFLEEVRCFFRGEPKPKTSHSGTRPLQSTNQPSQLSSAIVDSRGSAEFVPNMSNAKYSSVAELDSADEQVRSDNTRPTSMERVAELMDDRSRSREDRRSDNVEITTGAGAFPNSNIVIHNATMIDHSSIVQDQAPVLKILLEKMTKGANVDSSARWPLPKCYPGTRVRLTTEIEAWFFDDNRNWRFLWLSGPAGVGKSAVAQTVAEYAAEMDVLGAAYFFSRPNKRNKYPEIFITLAYQLAVRFPGYQPLLAARLSADPELLDKIPSVQFKQLIIEPLSLLSNTRKHAIILDGLDECDGEDNQLEIIELINNLLHSTISLPIIWMICSRQEAHLKRIFARPDYAVQCWREFLPIDSEESRSDTETFVRGRFREVHERYGEGVEEDADGRWPPEAAIEQIIEKTSGLFVLTDTLLKHIEDPETREPDQRLVEVLAFLKHSHLTGSRNPMHDVDMFYTRILSNIPDGHWSITRLILVASTFRSEWVGQLAVQPMCNLLGITRAKFYAAMRQLHSVIRIPEPSDAAETPLHFFHATFLDYLTDPNRAGRFFIGRIVSDYPITVAAGLRDFVQSGLRCLGSTIGLSVIAGGLQNDQEVSRSLETALSWPSGGTHANWASAASAVKDFGIYFFGLICLLLEHCELDDEVLNVLRSFDFNTLAIHRNYQLYSPLDYLDKLRLSSLVRTQSVSEWDQMLLSELAKKYFRIKPVDFDDARRDGFFLLGEGTNSVAVVTDQRRTTFRFISLKTPSQVWAVLQHTSLSWDDLRQQRL
ncbi:hypothetical protein P691DRAFT_779133 [Macrolepiota fuliginosa MF-IS2]|uniref:NACHT domain-containing protein n=1 Tax=Macrolepiota fuliginosa MF-IS2 TaxID=1400762 RepID=A0A9P6BZ06_9AGAR|nr:hypothetical protein P691DRAFT_779133 [Macrolepiota fuliginosa MF-IS2]